MNPAENWHTESGVAETETPASAPALPAPAAAPPVLRKNPALAALLSLFPGMGHNLPARYWPEVADAIAQTARAAASRLSA